MPTLHGRGTDGKSNTMREFFNRLFWLVCLAAVLSVLFMVCSCRTIHDTERIEIHDTITHERVVVDSFKVYEFRSDTIVRFDSILITIIKNDSGLILSREKESYHSYEHIGNEVNMVDHNSSVIDSLKQKISELKESNKEVISSVSIFDKVKIKTWWFFVLLSGILSIVIWTRR